MKRLAALLAFTSVLAACGSTVEATAPERLARETPLAATLIEAPRAYELPGGIHAADGRTYFAVEDGQLLRFGTQTGRVTRTYPLRGDWALSGVSSNGDWVALQRSETRILVVDATRGRTRELTLRGNFRVETISTAGDFLFLQQNFVDGSYAVRGYDVAAGQLLAGTLGRKGETVQMQGLAGQVVASPDGRWLLTLYVNTQTNTAFVHALNLIERVAICINVPPCTNCAPEALKRWGLALAPDGRTLFAANPALGRVATIDLPTYRVIVESSFRPSPGGPTRAKVSKDGSKLVFTNGRATWSFDPNASVVEPVL
jgi:DNA-binding beta-propeller fold protein YncE